MNDGLATFVRHSMRNSLDLNTFGNLIIYYYNRYYEKIGNNPSKCIDKELPFSIPDSWRWTKISSIADVKGGKRIPVGRKLQDENNGHIYIRVTDMQKETISSEHLKYVPIDVLSLIENYTISKNDLYLTIAGTIGKVGIVPDLFDNMNLTENAVKICNIKIYKLYLLNLILSNYVQKIFNKRTNKVAQPKLAIERIISCFIPIPPITEQQRIVKRIEELFNQIDIIENNQSDLEKLYDDLKKKTLDLAIRGKLVPQDPNDEPASELLKRIRDKKKAQLGKKYVDSYIYKGDDNCYYEHIDRKGKDEAIETPFNLPNGWGWIRLKYVLNVERGGSPRPISAYLTNSEDGLNWIKISDTEKGGKYINSSKERIKKEGLSKTRFVHKGDFLLTNSMSFGRPYILNIDGCIHDGWLVLSNNNHAYLVDYLYYLLSSSFAYQKFCKSANGAVVQNLNIDKVANAIFPIPPLAEQQRIVDNLSEIFAIL